MARKSTTRKTTKRKAAGTGRTQFQPQQLLLAGIGAVALGGKQLASAYANGFEGVVQLGVRAQDAAEEAARSLNGKVVALRKRARAKAAPVQKQVLALARQAEARVRTGLAPALVKLGLKPAPRKRSAPRKKPAARRTRKAA
jgi:hypothetical protein